ncbi:hypothetical protein D9758_004080 [Tetrapyrgos nigripes]|uniref:Uncharacterized protein n=1 Tax=Tetrapyrgos nigripes TaxID=182062 RepID=A0A8H5LVW1_9AGAR|nr:hypothetical protein D9758_004080 [Tetrapyrgos nigripes]
MSNIPVISVSLASLLTETFLYGCFFLLTTISMILVFVPLETKATALSCERRSFRTIIKRPMFISAFLILLSVTAHWICSYYRSWQAFITFEGGTQSAYFYADMSQTSQVAKTGTLVFALLVSDAMLIYRLWVVWDRNWKVIIFPILTLISLTICGFGITYQFTRYVPGMDVFDSAADRWITSDCVFTLSTNLYCTCFISWRIWKTNDALKALGASNLNNILVTFIESAMIYTIWTFGFFVSYEAHSNIQFIFVDSWAAIAGISFMLINVRLSLGWIRQSKTGCGNTIAIVTPISVNPTGLPGHPNGIQIPFSVHVFEKSPV